MLRKRKEVGEMEEEKEEEGVKRGEPSGTNEDKRVGGQGLERESTNLKSKENSGISAPLIMTCQGQ